MAKVSTGDNSRGWMIMNGENSRPRDSVRTGELKSRNHRGGSAYVLVALAVLVLTMLGVGALSVAWQERLESIRAKSEAVAMLTAEAGYEKAVYWMGQQQDMLSTLQNGGTGRTGSLNLLGGSCNYEVQLHTFAGARPIYKITSLGRSGMFSKMVDVLVVQAVSGWDMGMCKVPKSSTATVDVYFVTDETIDMPIHVNKQSDSPDKRDINVWGTPQFLRPVGMSESRHTAGGADKYAGVMGLFDGGICFDQPNSRITDAASVQTKVDRFRDTTKAQYQLRPVATGENVTNAKPAVQLEFFVGQNGVGKVIMTNDCTVRGFNQGTDNRTYDYKINSTGFGDPYERYDIYAYHLKRSEAIGAGVARDIGQTYVTQSIGSIESAPGGQIFVDGNVIIGGDRTEHNGDQVVKGRLTVVATGNIWIADSVLVAGSHDADGMPSADNPNVLGLIAQGVIKVVDPGMSEYSYVDGSPVEEIGVKYAPIGRLDSGQPAGSNKRHLPDPTVVEAAITVGGGGWGAENVQRGSYGGRKQASGNLDFLAVHGTIVEAMRGLHGVMNTDGYLRSYHMDERLLQGILPGDIWLRGKYVATPAGWHDYRSAN